jgi:diguanylate cyclase (GGDEF)-like protein/PAS domain S-box-containing protein
MQEIERGRLYQHRERVVSEHPRRSHRLQALATTNAFQSALTIAAFGILDHFRLVASIPLWVFALITVAAMLLGQLFRHGLETATGPGLHLRVAWGVVTTGTVMYATGWGPLLAVGFLIGAEQNIRLTTGRATGACLLWTLVGITAGQSAVAFGFAPSMLGGPQVHALAALGALGVAFAIVRVGTTRRDIGAAEARLRQQAKWSEALLNDISDIGEGVVMTEDERIVYCNEAYLRLTGYSLQELQQLPTFFDIISPEARSALLERRARRARGDPLPASEESLIVTKDGRQVDVEFSVRSVAQEGRTRLIAVVRDITERKLVNATLAAKVGELAAIAASDPLTGLANRREFERRLALPRSTPFGILAIDVDHLKSINDFYGHEAGDTHLRIVASTLEMGMRDADCVARTGGDEFTVFLPRADLQEAAAVAHRLREMMHGIVVPHGQARITIGCAVGTPAADASVVWAAADEALYRAKRLGRDRVELSPEGAATSYTLSLERWEPILRSLGREPLIIPAYQPIVHFADGSVRGYEALARLGDMAADASIESLFVAAQRLGVHRDLDWICRRAAVQGAHNLSPRCPLFINVGAAALLDPLHDVDQFLLLLRWARRSPEELVLEITEREAVRDFARLGDVLEAYRRHGIRFALDDVGEGFSTLELLAAATPDFIKISGKLAKQIDSRGAQGAIRALVTFARTTGTELIAEGIETAREAAQLFGVGVQLGQGFALGRPTFGGIAPEPEVDAAAV